MNRLIKGITKLTQCLVLIFSLTKAKNKMVNITTFKHNMQKLFFFSNNIITYAVIGKFKYS